MIGDLKPFGRGRPLGPKCLPGGACVFPHSREKGRKERETLQQMAEVTREGFRLKKILIEDWKKAREEKQVRGPAGLTQDDLEVPGWKGWVGFTSAPDSGVLGAVTVRLCLVSLLCPLGFFCVFFSVFFLPFLGPLPGHMEVPRLGVQSEL